jgi:DNA-binding response OmpR family regulator
LKTPTVGDCISVSVFRSGSSHPLTNNKFPAHTAPDTSGTLPWTGGSGICFLSCAEGYGALEAEPGDHAFDRALDPRYSSIILDVMLPGRDGVDVVAELRSRGVFTPVLMLTAKDELESRVRGLEAGADDYLTKPVDLAELLARVHALIRRAELRNASLFVTAARPR